MITIIDTISAAGARSKQNDDRIGHANSCAWVCDGATDLIPESLTGWASDASWIADRLNGHLYQSLQDDPGQDPRALTANAATRIKADFEAVALRPCAARHEMPTTSLLLLQDLGSRLRLSDLGDSRVFILDATGHAHTFGGPTDAPDREAEEARALSEGRNVSSLLRDSDVLAHLRGRRALHNQPDGYWVFGLEAVCAQNMRVSELSIPRPAFALLMSDGLSILSDRYKAYTPKTMVEAALTGGLAALVSAVRHIETESDPDGTTFARYKKSDDASGILLRLD